MGTYSQLLQKPQPQIKPKAPAAPKPQAHVEEPQEASMLARKKDSKLASKNASMLAISPFTNDDVMALRQSTYNQLNVRGTETEAEWLKDVAYQLGKEVKRGRVNQGDIIRVGLRLFQKLMDTNKPELIKILEDMS